MEDKIKIFMLLLIGVCGLIGVIYVMCTTGRMIDALLIAGVAIIGQYLVRIEEITGNSEK